MHSGCYYFSRHGAVQAAHNLFDESSHKNMVSCTTLIIKEAEVMLKSMPMKHDGAIWDQFSMSV